MNPPNTIQMPRAVCDYISTYEPRGKWNLFHIEKANYSVDNYKIYILIDSSNNVFMKPYEPYVSGDFERLFDFGVMCTKYSPHKIIMVTEPKYHTHFVSYFDHLHENNS